MSAELAQKKHIHLELRLPSEDMKLDADTSRLVQVFCNLITNAIKFSDEGSQVVIQAEPRENSYEVQVRDQGAGIEADQLEAVFEPFVQAPAGRQQQSGLGLGLALVKQVVRLHSGTVSAASEGLGRGATFTVSLPRSRPGLEALASAPG